MSVQASAESRSKHWVPIALLILFAVAIAVMLGYLSLEDARILAGWMWRGG